MKKLALTLIVIAVLAPAAEARKRRAAHHPAIPCSFTLAQTWSGSVAPGGVSRAAVLVFGQTAECSRWGAYSSAPWITVEAAPLAAQPAAYVTVAANSDLNPRIGTIVVAGVRLQVSQEGAASIAPRDTNVVPNGGFDTAIAPWGWPSRFPNGTGVAQWSQFDANGNPASGSIMIRDTNTGLAYQQQQCVRVAKNTSYTYGAKARAVEGRDRGEGMIAVFPYPTPDCTGDFIGQYISVMRPAEPGVWQEFSFSMRTGSRTEAVIIVIASAANIPPFDIWIDDVFIRP